VAGFEDVDASAATGAVVLNGSQFNNTLTGGAFADTLMGGAGFDVLKGGLGNDFLDGGGDADQQRGEAGDDRIVYDAADTVIDGGAGRDTLVLKAAAIVHLENFSSSQVTGGAYVLGFEDVDATDSVGGITVTGSQFNNTLTGGAFADTLMGGAGFDVLKGGLGNDFLDGGADADQQRGEAGDDRIVYDAADTVIDGGAGRDTLILNTAVTVNLGNFSSSQATGGAGYVSGFEDVDASGATAAVRLNGSAFNNTLIGGGGADTLAGGPGFDTLTGGKGSDLFVFGAFTSGDIDKITDFSHAHLEIHRHALAWSQSGPPNRRRLVPNRNRRFRGRPPRSAARRRGGGAAGGGLFQRAARGGAERLVGGRARRQVSLGHDRFLAPIDAKKLALAVASGHGGRVTQELNDGLPAREGALALIDAALSRRGGLDEAASANAFRFLEPRERAFARALAMAALRHLGPIDRALAGKLAKEPPPRVRNLLRLGATQAFFLEVPAFAAVATSVELAGANKASRPFKGLVNAVLRGLLRDGALSDASEHLAPPWLYARWVSAYGKDIADAVAAQIGFEPATDLSLKPDFDATALAAELEGEILPGGTLRTERRGDVSAWPAFDDGVWWIQDAAAADPRPPAEPQGRRDRAGPVRRARRQDDADGRGRRPGRRRRPLARPPGPRHREPGPHVTCRPR
jgi:hypothetical protein